MSDPLEPARRLIAWGIPVFACPPGAGPKGYQLPARWQAIEPDERRLEVWRPGYALAMVCGRGLDVLDVDPRNGGEASWELLCARGLVPRAYATATTPNGGHHTFIRSLGLGKRTIAPGLDLQAGAPDGSGRGFVFLPPTGAVALDGERRAYRWAAEPAGFEDRPGGGYDPTGLRLRVWIAEQARERPASAPGGSQEAGGELGEPIPHGRHDETLTAYVWRLRRRLPESETLALALARGRDCVPPTWTEAMTREKVARAYAKDPGQVGQDWPLIRFRRAEREPEDEPDPFRPIDWQALWDEPEDEDWLLEPLIPARRSVALYSAPKVGKSLLLLEVAVRVSQGAPVAGMTPPEPVTVLYVDHENDPRGDVRSRLRAMGVEPGDLGRLRYLSFPPMSALDGPAGGAQLLEVAQREGAALVVLDTVSRTIAGEENANDTWLAFYRNTGRALKAAGIAYVRLDHSGKDEGKGMRGGSAKSGDVDAVWRLEARETEGEFLLACDMSRIRMACSVIGLRRVLVPHLRHDRILVSFENDRLALQSAIREVLDATGEPGSVSDKQAKAAVRAAGIKAGNEVIQGVWKAWNTPGNVILRFVRGGQNGDD